MPSVESARAGKNPKVVTKLPSGWLMFGHSQFLPGYCVLIADPVVVDLNALDDRDRAQFLSDMVLVGDALHQVTDTIRINYEIMGHITPVLHAHISPRYKWEPPEKLKGPTAHYDESEAPIFDLERDRPLMQAIAEAIDAIKKG
jgi:diadenosine tetraphosphate (Ap4A) HIT family hydrolase